MSLDIPVIFQSKEIVAVEKPIGVSIHNTEDAFNLIDLVESQLEIKKLFPVHRLDKETSGVQIFALNDEAARRYAEQFQTREVKKIYIGILRGVLKGANAEGGIWSQPLTDKSEGRANPAGISNDRIPCETRYIIRQVSKYFTKCEFDLITGRQHQIRKHAAIAGHALIGDPRYADQKYNRKINSLYGDARMFLHCSAIEVLGRRFESPEPETFDRLFGAP